MKSRFFVPLLSPSDWACAVHYALIDGGHLASWHLQGGWELRVGTGSCSGS